MYLVDSAPVWNIFNLEKFFPGFSSHRIWNSFVDTSP